MAIKKSVLTFFATLASVTVVANNLMHVSAPTVLSETPSEISRTTVATEVIHRIEPVAPAPLPAIQLPAPSSAEPALASMPVAATPSDAAPVIVLIPEPKASVDTAQVVIPAAEMPAIASTVPAPESNRVWVSEWLDVPRDVIERLRNTKTPNDAVLTPETPNKVAKQRPLIDNIASHISHLIYGRESVPMPVAPVAQSPYQASVIESVDQNAAPPSDASVASVQPEIRQVSAPPVAAEPEDESSSELSVIAETSILGLASIARRVLLPTPVAPETSPANTVPQRSAAMPIEQPVSEVSSAIVERKLSPEPVPPAFAPADRSVAIVETTVAEPESIRSERLPIKFIEAAFMPVAGAIYRRALLPVPTAPGESAATPQQVAVNESPRPVVIAEVTNPVTNISSEIAKRELLPVPEPPAVETAAIVPASDSAAVAPATGPVTKSFQLIETVFAELSSRLYARPQIAMPDAPAAPVENVIAASEPKAESAKPISQLPIIQNASSQPSSTVYGRTMEPIPADPAAPAVQTMVPPPSVAATTVPVTINSQAKYSGAMLMPFDLGPQPEVKTFSHSDSANHGPTIEAAAVKDTYANLKAVEKAKATAVPVMISSNSSFSVDMLHPMRSSPVYPPNPYSVISQQGFEGSYCDPNFKGAPIRFAQTVELKLDDLLNQLNSRFGVNFIVGPGIGTLPLSVKAGSIPWNVLLRSQLYVSGVRANCIAENTVELVLNSKVVELEKGRLEGEKLESRYIKLKYLQPSSSGNKNIAGQSSSGGGSSSQSGSGQSGSGQGGCQQQNQSGSTQGSGQQLPPRCKFERLINEIKQMLGLNDPLPLERIESPGISSVTFKQPEVAKRPYVGQVPGRNMLLVNATPGQLKEVDELIRRADVPPFQVVIKGLVYTANEDKLRDIGVQTTLTEGSGNTTGGIFGHTLGNLGTLFDFSTLIGTVDFNVQASALQRDGVISIKSRPFATVLDGDTTDLTVGRQVPVLIQAINPVGGAPGTLQILQAANLLSVTPHVIDDDKGNPTAINLELQLESNDVDATVNSQGVPAISVRSIQTNIILNQEQTAILGGFTLDSDGKTISKTPFLGDIPILGELFKRRVRSTQVNRLYFAISVSVIPYGGVIEPVKVPGATTDPPTITQDMLDRAKSIEPKPLPTPSPTPRTKTDNR